MNLWLKSELDEALSRHLLEWQGGTKPSTLGLNKRQRIKLNCTEASCRKMAVGRGVQLVSACLAWGPPNTLLKATPDVVNTACHVDGRCFQTAVIVTGDTHFKIKHSYNPNNRCLFKIHSWPLKNMGLNCIGPLTHGLLSINVQSVLHILGFCIWGFNQPKASIFHLQLGSCVCGRPSWVTHGLLTAEGIGSPNPHIVQRSTVFIEHLILAMDSSDHWRYRWKSSWRNLSPALKKTDDKQIKKENMVYQKMW